MSQEKVDYHKDQKANRKKILKKKRRHRIYITCGIVVVFVALFGWIGYSAYTNYQTAHEGEVIYNDINISAISDFLSNLSADETEESTDEESTEEAEEETTEEETIEESTESTDDTEETTTEESSEDESAEATEDEATEDEATEESTDDAEDTTSEE